MKTKLAEKETGDGDPSSVFCSLTAVNPRSVSKEELFVPDKEKSAEKLEEFFKNTLEEVFRAFLTRCGAKRSLLRLCIVK